MLIRSDARHIPLADESVHCVVTSPPYWGLRAYKGNPGMIGLEPTFEEHLENLVSVFREVKRVLRHDGCLFLNYGDAHASCQMFSHQVQLREHLTEDEYVEAALALSRGMSELWAEDGEGTSEGSLSELLQQKEEGAVHGRPAAAAENAGSKQSVTCQASEEAQRQVGRKKSGKASLGHRTSGKSMRLLRRDGADFPVSRPHQRRRAPGTQETGGHDASVQTGNKGGSAAKQISGPMLELQRRSRALGILSSLVIDKSDIPAGAERFFEPASNLKPKDLMMMPERIAMALQADGWWLRQKIPWLKRSGMPESTEDRPGSSLEFVYLLTKSGDPLFWTHPEMRGVRTKPEPNYFYVNKEEGIETDQAPDGWKEDDDWKRRNRWKAHDYFYDGYAVRMRLAHDTQDRYERGRSQQHKWSDGGPGDQTIAKSFKHMRKQQTNGRSFRNTDLMFESIREPWGLITDADGNPLAIDVPPKGFKGAHFATFPEKLVEPFIKAGTSEKGCCAECGAPWARDIERPTPPDDVFGVAKDADGAVRRNRSGGVKRTSGGQLQKWLESHPTETTGWKPTCSHEAPKVPAPCLIRSWAAAPFAG